METTYTFTYQSVTIEVTVTPDEDAEEALRDAIQTINDVAEDATFESASEGSSVQSTLPNGGVQPPGSMDSGSNEEADSSEIETDQREENDLADLARDINIDVDTLREAIDIDPSREHLPFVNVDSDHLGDKKVKRQYDVAHMILYMYHQCYPDADRMSSSDLKDQVEASRVSANNLYNIYNYEQGDTNFDRQGRGNSATIALTRPGMRDARSIIRNVLNESEDDDS